MPFATTTLSDKMAILGGNAVKLRDQGGLKHNELKSGLRLE
jgi:hypothetical protein